MVSGWFKNIKLIVDFYFYHYYISSTSDHQILDPRGWGALPYKAPCAFAYLEFSAATDILPQFLQLISVTFLTPGWRDNRWLHSRIDWLMDRQKWWILVLFSFKEGINVKINIPKTIFPLLELPGKHHNWGFVQYLYMIP